MGSPVHHGKTAGLRVACSTQSFLQTPKKENEKEEDHRSGAEVWMEIDQSDSTGEGLVPMATQAVAVNQRKWRVTPNDAEEEQRPGGVLTPLYGNKFRSSWWSRTVWLTDRQRKYLIRKSECRGSQSECVVLPGGGDIIGGRQRQTSTQRRSCFLLFLLPGQPTLHVNYPQVPEAAESLPTIQQLHFLTWKCFYCHFKPVCQSVSFMFNKAAFL